MPYQIVQKESGRSMVEMLGVLAIIGVLSIGGIMGYSYAMDKHKANLTVEDLKLRMVALITQTNAPDTLNLSEFDINGRAGFPISVLTYEDSKLFGLEVENVPQRICQMVAEMMQDETCKALGKVLPAPEDLVKDYTGQAVGHQRTDATVQLQQKFKTNWVFTSSDCAGWVINTANGNAGPIGGRVCDKTRIDSSYYQSVICKDPN